MACVAQGIVYVGGAVGGLRVMAARAEVKRAERASGASGASGKKLATGVPKQAPERA